jgi:hypothetical protein
MHDDDEECVVVLLLELRIDFNIICFCEELLFLIKITAGMNCARVA